jgi:proline iminopeptidase
LRGNGFYSNIFTNKDANTKHAQNPRQLLSSNQTPALILVGSCNYIKWEVEYQYKQTLPNSTLLYIPRAGHVIYLDQPDIYFASIRAFLLNKPLPLQPWTSSTPPPPDK